MCRAWAQDVTIPTTQTSTASGLTSQMWNLETISSRFVQNTRWDLLRLLKSRLESHFIPDIWTLLALNSLFKFYWLLSTGQCKSQLSRTRKWLQQQCCALWCSLHRQLRLCVRLSHVAVSITSQLTNVSPIFLVSSTNPHCCFFFFFFSLLYFQILRDDSHWQHVL